MDPLKLAEIVSLLGMAAFVSWLMQLAAARVAGRSPDPSLLHRIANSKAWPATAHAAFVAWLTALGIEIALVGVTERTASIGAIWSILALSLLVGRQIDAIQDRMKS